MGIRRVSFAIAHIAAILVFALPAEGIVINLIGTNCAAYTSVADQTTGDVTISCKQSSQPTNAPPGNCTLSGSASSLTFGTPYTLTAKCATGDATSSEPIEFIIEGGPSRISLKQTAVNTSVQYPMNTLPVSATPYKFVATATNKFGSSPMANTAPSVTIAAESSGGGGTNNLCSAEGFSATNVIDLVWASSASNVTVPTSANGGFGVNTAVVAKFTTPANASARSGLITFYEYVDPPTNRIVTLSTQPCGRGTVLEISQGTTASIYFSVGTSIAGLPTLAKDTPYYFTIVNRDSAGRETCGSTCNGRVELLKPKGL